MKNLKKRLFPLVPVFALLLSMVIGTIKVRTAAVLSPCQEQEIAQRLAPVPKVAAAFSESTGNVAIFILRGMQMIEATRTKSEGLFLRQLSSMLCPCRSKLKRSIA
jgi:TRAP-type uncharacterized transport system fused permease subunit